MKKKGTTLIFGDSRLSGLIVEKKMFWNKKIKVGYFPGAKIKDVYHNAIPLLRGAIQFLLKIRKSYERFLKRRSKAFEALRRSAHCSWGPDEPWWGLGVEARGKCCDLAHLETPWFAYFSIIANAKKQHARRLQWL